MTAIYTDHAQGQALHSRIDGNRLRNGIGMAIILCAGIAGGIMLSSDFNERISGYGAHAEGYLYDDGASFPDSAPAVTTVSSQQAAVAPVCEEYTKLVTVGGQSETIYGTACRQPDGTWDIVQ